MTTEKRAGALPTITANVETWKDPGPGERKWRLTGDLHRAVEAALQDARRLLGDVDEASIRKMEIAFDLPDRPNAKEVQAALAPVLAAAILRHAKIESLDTRKVDAAELNRLLKELIEAEDHHRIMA